MACLSTPLVSALARTRSYLTQLSEDTNAFFRESPTPAELIEIYTDLADLLRTQYDVTLDVDVPLDGRVWQLELEVDTPWGPVRSNGTLRAGARAHLQLPTRSGARTGALRARCRGDRG